MSYLLQQTGWALGASRRVVGDVIFSAFFGRISDLLANGLFLIIKPENFNRATLEYKRKHLLSMLVGARSSSVAYPLALLACYLHSKEFYDERCLQKANFLLTRERYGTDAVNLVYRNQARHMRLPYMSTREAHRLLLRG